MTEHHIQKKILYQLVTNPSTRFAELRPKGMDSNIFTYHLKELMADKLVIKNEDGTYGLTALGRVAGINVTLDKKELLEQAHSVLLMCLKTEKEGWLLRRRLAHPMYQKVGFVHGEPIATEPAADTATRIFFDRTGVTAEFKPAGTGYVRLFHNEELESFTHFTLFTANTYTGNLETNIKNGENYWDKNPDFNDESMIPSMPDIVKLLGDTEGLFYADLNYQV